MPRGVRKAKKGIAESIRELDERIMRAETELKRMYQEKDTLLCLQEEEEAKGLLRLMKEHELSIDDISTLIHEHRAVV